MATTELDTLLAKIDATMAPLRGEIAKTNSAIAKAMQQSQKEVERFNTSLEKVGSFLRGTIAGALSALSVAKLASMTRESLKWAEATEQQAKWIGISANALAAYEDGARKAGVETGKMGQALEKMIGNLADASADPNSGPAKIFRQLGLDVKSANADVDAFLGKLADKIQNLSKNDKLIVGKTLFGDKMDDVVRVFEGGAAGLAKMRAEFDRLNPGFAQQVKYGAEMNRQYEAMSKQIDTQLKTVLVELGPVLLELLGIVNMLVKGFATMARDSGLIKGTLQQRIADYDEKIAAAENNPNKGFNFNKDRLAQLRREREALLEDRANEAAYGDAGKFAAPTKDKRDIIKTGGESELEKKLREIREEAYRARLELEIGPDAAAWEKYYAELDRLGATSKQRQDAYANFLSKWNAEGAKSLQDFGKESERMARIAAAEAMGRKDLVAVLELEFQTRQKYGDRFVKENAAAIQQQALLRYEIERTRERSAAAMQALESIADSAFSNMASALFSFENTNETVWERIRNVGFRVMQDLLNEMIRLSIINPLKNLAFGQNNPTFGDALSKLAGVVPGLFGISVGGKAPAARAEGGPVTAGVPYLVGERRPELFVPNVSGTIVPRVPTGGNVTLVGSDSSMIELGQIKSALRRLGMQVRQVDGSIETRAVAATIDARYRGGAAARAFGG